MSGEETDYQTQRAAEIAALAGGYGEEAGEGQPSGDGAAAQGGEGGQGAAATTGQQETVGAEGAAAGAGEGEGGEPAAADAGAAAAAGGEGAGTGESQDGQQAKGMFIPVNRHKEILQQHQRRADEAAAEVSRLQRELEEARQQKPTAQNAADISEIESKIEKLKGVMPDEIVEVVTSLANTVKAERAARESDNERFEQERASSKKEAAQAAIDQVPDLKEWQQKGGILWREALRVDQELAKSDEYRGKPLVERFAAAAKRVREEVGLPDAPEPKKPDAHAAATTTKPSAEKPLPAKGEQVPTTLSSLPNGRAPNNDGALDLEAMNQLDSFEVLRKLSPAEQEKAVLRTFGG